MHSIFGCLLSICWIFAKSGDFLFENHFCKYPICLFWYYYTTFIALVNQLVVDISFILFISILRIPCGMQLPCSDVLEVAVIVSFVQSYASSTGCNIVHFYWYGLSTSMVTYLLHRIHPQSLLFIGAKLPVNLCVFDVRTSHIQYYYTKILCF